MQLYKSFEQAKDEVEKLRQELYPNLYSASVGDDAADVNNSTLDTIAEDTNELTDTNNDFTEDTSEPLVSDDEVRGRNMDEEEGDNNTDSGEFIDDVNNIL